MSHPVSHFTRLRTSIYCYWPYLFPIDRSNQKHTVGFFGVFFVYLLSLISHQRNEYNKFNLLPDAYIRIICYWIWFFKISYRNRYL